MIKHKLISLFVALVSAANLFAYKAYIDGIYYNLNSTDMTAEVTNETGDYSAKSYSGSITIPASVSYSGKTYSVTTIGNHAFDGCSGLTSVTIPNSVTAIGDRAFYNCSGLTSVTIPNSVTTIGEDAFAGCSGLTSITIPNSVTTIGDFAFYYCSGLTSVTIPNSVTTIGDYAFYYCRGLTSVTIGNSVTSIGDFAFYGCSGLTSPVFNVNCFAYMPTSYKGDYIIPNGIKLIAGAAFAYCSGLTEVTIPNSVTTIGNSAFEGRGLTSIIVDAANTHYCSVDGVLFNYTKDTLIQYPIGNTRTEYTIPNSVTTIGDYAFRGCSGLTSVTIPNSVTTIGEDAFCGCKGLTSVTIPNSVTTIGRYAFYGCTGLTSVTCYATTHPTCGYSCFYNVDKTIPVYVPAQSISAYKQAEVWKEFTNIQALKQGQCGDDLTWKFNDGVLVISGTGAMYDYTQDTAPWTLFKESISNIVINNGCTSIGNFAFYGLSNKNFKIIELPNSITEIGQYAFAECSWLKNVYLGAYVEQIKGYAFANDDRLLYITCYAIEPPLLQESAFVNYDAYLSVPCAAQADYKVAKGWKLFNKENVSCIGAEEKPITGDEVTVNPSADNVTITWPANDNAAEYSLVITKDGVVFCTLTFNAQGQLIGIAFAPNRAGSRMLDAAVMTSNGWQFTVTGLDQACKYGYTIDALNASKQSIKHYEGEFATDGYTSLEWVTSDHIQGMNKMLLNGHLYILRDNKLFNATGTKVK